MKNFFKSAVQLSAAISFVLSFAQGSLAASTATAPASKDVAIGLTDVFVPGGFDSNSDAYVVASGLFPNGCYQWKGADVKHVDNYNHEVQPYASVSQGMCIMVLVPFNKEIRLGKLNSGAHTLKFLNGDGTYLLKNLRVE